jgi:hypothetical protein
VEIATMTANYDRRIELLVSLVSRLRYEVLVLEAKRVRLALAEATLELLRGQRQKEGVPPSEEVESGVKGPSGGGPRSSEGEKT